MADNKLLGTGSLYYGGNEISKAYMGNNLVWEKVIDYSKEYLTYVSLEDDNQIRYRVYGNITQRTIQVSIDNGKTWTSFSPSESTGTLLATLNKNQKIQIRGNNAYYGSGSWNCHWIETTKYVNVYGNIMSLFNSTSFTTLYTISYSYALGRWFRNAKIKNASNLILPATTLSDNCYYCMFDYCNRMEVGPIILPATTLSVSCYSYMFSNCTSLINAPELPATRLANYCYYYMFSNCTSLTAAPSLPATTLKNYCYSYMFNGCTSLTAAPSLLPAMTLQNGCYNGMFCKCSTLTTAPELPAISLVNYCYFKMFNGCTSLNYIKAMFITTPSTTYTNYWVSDVSPTGTFVKNSAARWNATGVYGIPSGWTVQTASS